MSETAVCCADAPRAGESVSVQMRGQFVHRVISMMMMMQLAAAAVTTNSVKTIRSFAFVSAFRQPLHACMMCHEIRSR
jgi:hypothetical protein